MLLVCPVVIWCLLVILYLHPTPAPRIAQKEQQMVAWISRFAFQKTLGCAWPSVSVFSGWRNILRLFKNVLHCCSQGQENETNLHRGRVAREIQIFKTVPVWFYASSSRQLLIAALSSAQRQSQKTAARHHETTMVHICILFITVVCVHGCTCHTVHVNVKEQLVHLSSPYTFLWIPGIKLMSSGFQGKLLYCLSHLASPHHIS